MKSCIQLLSFLPFCKLVLMLSEQDIWVSLFGCHHLGTDHLGAVTLGHRRY